MASTNVETIEDEELLHKMLNQTENFDERKKIRHRLRELREAHTREWERKRAEREAEREDAIKMRQRQAEAEKQRKMQEFKKMASEHVHRKDLGGADAHIRQKHAQAELEKQKKLEQYKELGASAAGAYGHSADQITLKKPGKEEAATFTSTKTETGPDGRSTTTTTTTTTQKSKGKPQQSAMAAFKSMDAAAGGGAKPNFLSAGGGGGKVSVQRSPSTIKQMLLDWCKAMTKGYEHVDIQNFSSSWNNGMAFCALIHHFHPEAFDYSKLNPKARRGNFKLAFDVAEKYADITPLLEVDDMVRMKNPDWKCVFTQVQMYYRKFRDYDKNKHVAGGEGETK